MTGEQVVGRIHGLDFVRAGDDSTRDVECVRDGHSTDQADG